MEKQNEKSNPFVSVVLPCFNEEEAIGACLQKINQAFLNRGIDGEVIVADNGSTDRSSAIAESMGARVVFEPVKGYGRAYQTGFANAKGKFFIMADADDTYDLTELSRFLEKLNEGYDFVTGSRYLSAEGKQNISFWHRIVGNPILTSMLNRFFGMKYTDVYCGYRAFSRRAYQQIEPISPGMEFNLELAINAWKAKLNIVEIPIILGPRVGKSKLRTIRDGWRSLRMLLLYSPNKVFLYPGIFLLLFGLGLHAILLFLSFFYVNRFSGNVAAIFSTIFSVVGFQIINLGLYAKSYSWSRRLDKENKVLEKFYRYFKLETGLLVGVGILSIGVVIILSMLIQWLKSNLAPLAHPELASFGATMIIIGCNTLFSSLFISAMSIKEKP